MTATATRKWKSLTQTRAELATLDQTLLAELTDLLFRAWKAKAFKTACLAVRKIHGDNPVLLEWVNHRLNERIATEVSPVYLVPVGDPAKQVNWLIDPLPTA
ncbi:MAG: hypothetical protein HOY78_02545 [Saccharothrix sp.]|nr:hypothetical protein [Saccharothrix sp.]